MSGKRSSKEGTFGAPKPLPGQPGYNMSESDRLDKDTRDMEMRLLMLQERMKQQNLDNDKQRPAGGTKWKSARPDKGSVAQYGKEVREKVKERLGKSNTNLLTGKPSFNTLTDSFGQASIAMEKENLHAGTTASSTDSRELSRDFATKEVSQWTTVDVGHWLSSLQLEQYAESFAQNEIDGKTLVDLTLEDLDYLHVTALAHRKALFREVEALRAQHARTSSSTDPPRELLRSHSAPRDVVPPKRTHWSQVPPLSDQPPPDTTGGASSASLLVNAADAPDLLDEEAERRAFQDAVREWRRQDAAAAAVTRVHDANPSTPAPPPSSTDRSDMWVNPFAPRAPTETGTGTGTPPRLAGGPGDVLDEAAEHAAFVQAVEAWRQARGGGGGGGGGRRSCTSTGQQAGDDLPPPPPAAAAQGLAATLAAALDAEQQRLQRQLEIQRRQAEQRLAVASADLHRMRREHAAERLREEQTRARADQGGEDGDGDGDGFDDSVQSEGDDLPDDCAGPYSPGRPPSAQPAASTVRVALVSSELGQMAGADPPDCVIEYASSDDDDA